MNSHESQNPVIFAAILQELTLAAADLLEPGHSLDGFLELLARKTGAARALLLERDFVTGQATLSASAGLSASQRQTGTRAAWSALGGKFPFSETGKELRWDFEIVSGADAAGPGPHEPFQYLLTLAFSPEARIPEPYRAMIRNLCGLLKKALEYRRRFLAVSERNRAIIEATPGGIARLAPDGTILEINTFGARLLGLGAVPASGGLNLADLLVPADRERFRALQAEILAGTGTEGVAQIQFDVPVASPAAGPSKRSLEAHAVPFRDSSGRTSSVIAVIHDVTQRRQLQAQLFHAERMGAMGVLAAGVAHEINNPLTYVITNLDLTRESLAAAPAEAPLPAQTAAEIRQMVSEAIQGAERVRGIVKDLKVFSHAQDETVADVDVAAVLDYSLKLVQNDLKHRARVVREFGAVPRVIGSERKLGQVFVNLLLNAIQSLPEGEADRHAIHLTTRLDSGGRVAIEVRDTGRGIPRENLARIFDPFFTTKGVGSGTGLGLSICHGIVLAFGGEIAVESEPGRGTAFTIYLRPAPAAVQAEPARTAARGSDAPARRSLKVLIIDRDPKLAEALRRTLRKDDHVVFAPGTTEAARQLGQSPAFDLVFCDLSAPERHERKEMMDLCDRISSTRPELSGNFVFMTGGDQHPGEKTFLESAARQGNRALEKPFDPRAVRSLLSRAPGPRPPEAPSP